MRIGAPRMEDAKAFSLRLNRIAVLAQLNGGEIFLEEEVGDAQLWFGVRFEKSRCCAMAQSGPVKAVTGV